jgi:VWFA-related protein
MRIGFGLAAALFVACATPHTLSGQQPPASPASSSNVTPTQPQKSESEPKPQVSMEDTVDAFKVRVNLVQVPVIVRDSAGKSVEGLRKEDFQLYDNGKLQTISTFAVENAQSRKERTEAAQKTQESAGEDAASSSATLPENFVALTFDDVHLKMEDAGPLRVASAKFIDSMTPVDRVGIFSTSGQFTLDFTSDKEALKQKLIGLIPRGAIDTRTHACLDITYWMADQVENKHNPQVAQIVRQEVLNCEFSGDPASGAAVAAVVKAAVDMELNAGDADSRQTYNQLEQVLRLLSAKPGERILLFASPGFPLATLTFQASQVIEHANRANIVINSLDARGLYTPDLVGDIAQGVPDPPSMLGTKTINRLAEQTDKQFVLMDFSYGTGGRFFHNSNDLEGGLKQLGMMPEVSYVLGFSPPNEKMDGHFHTLKVTLSEKQNYAVQARRGYYAPKKVDDPQEAENQEMKDALVSRDEIHDLALTLQTQYFKTGDGGARVSVVSHIGLKDLRFRLADGRHNNELKIATVIFDDNGNYVTNSGKIVKLLLLDSAFDEWRSTGLMVKSSFDLKPGKYLIRQVVRDSEGAQMAARNGILSIPD